MLHDLLRRATADVHARLEARLPLMDPSLTHAEYGALVGRLHALHVAVEAGLARWGAPLAAIGVDLGRRAKVALLDRDVRALGVVPAAATAALAADADAVTATLGRAVGCLYVVEGATLGGQVVRRRLARTLGVGEGTGAAYYASYGDAVGPMWVAFQRALAAFAESCPQDAGPDGDVVRGARETFALFERQLCGAGPGDVAGRVEAVA